MYVADEFLSSIRLFEKYNKQYQGDTGLKGFSII